LSTSALCGVQERHPSLAACATLDRLLLQAFRFHALTAEQRAAIDSTDPQFQPRPGMVQLGPLLPDGLLTDMAFVWNVHNFGSLNVESLYSPPITVNGNRWSIYMWPRRKCPQPAGKETEWVSIYLNSVDVKNGDVEQLPSYAFELTVKNYKNSAASITREYEHAFDSLEVDWGLSRFVQCSSVMDPCEGFLNGGTLTIVCAIHQVIEEEEVRCPGRRGQASSPAPTRTARACARRSLRGARAHASCPLCARPRPPSLSPTPQTEHQQTEE
jgi:hypothetical protein